jgi:hypothetical protein
MTRPSAIAAHLAEYEEVAAKSPEVVKALNQTGRVARRLAQSTHDGTAHGALLAAGAQRGRVTPGP